MDKQSEPSSSTCRFCKIIRHEIDGYLVFEDEISVAFLDHRPLFAGHCLLVPRGHHETLIDLPSPLIGGLFNNVQLIANAMEQAFECDGSFVAINNRVSQSVPHMHIHLVPRRHKDGLKGFFWPRQAYKDRDSILEVQGTLRSAIAKLRPAP